MQLLTTAEQMQEFDRNAITRYAIPGLVLMENAGRACVSVLEAKCPPLASKRVVVVCGKGNNGGDGFVIARHLLNKGCSVDVLLLGKRREVRGDAATNLRSVLRLAGAKRGLRFGEVTSGKGFKRRNKPDIIVDAIFGTGFTGKVRGVYDEAIRWINDAGAFTIAVDIASGVQAGDGLVQDTAVDADVTVTMAAPKIGQFVGGGRDHSGDVVVVDIGIPQFVFRPSRPQAYRVVAQDVCGMLPARPMSAHKYSVGKVFVIAGSREFSGAPLMCAQAALRSGAGAVILGVPRSIHATMARKLTEVIVVPLEETVDGTVALAALSRIREKAGWADVVVLGPGLSRNDETDLMVREAVATIERPLVLDADGLTALVGKTGLLKRRKGETILTPHAGELSRLTGESARSIELRRVEAVREAARLFEAVVILKGSPTATSTPAGDVYLNSTGNPGMATIGSGDVLTGLVAGLGAQGMPSHAAAWGGVYIHGAAGDISAMRLGQRSILAHDILDAVPDAIQSVEAS